MNRLRRLIEYRMPVDPIRLDRFREHLEIITLLEKEIMPLPRPSARPTSSIPVEKDLGNTANR